VLGKLTGKEKADGGLDLAGREGALLVVAGQAGSLKGQALEDVVDERVQDRHATLGDTGVGVHLLEDLVDVRRVGLNALLALATLGTSLLGGLCFLSCLLWALLGCWLFGLLGSLLLGLFDLLDLRFLGLDSLEATRCTNSLDLGNLFVSD